MKLTEGERTARILNKHGWTFDSDHGSWNKSGFRSALLLDMACDPPAALRARGDEACAREVERSYR